MRRNISLNSSMTELLSTIFPFVLVLPRYWTLVVRFFSRVLFFGTAQMALPGFHPATQHATVIGLNLLRSYLFSLGPVALTLFTASVVALITQKITLISLHRPLPIFGAIIYGPFCFLFDIITLFLLHHGLS